MNKPLVSKIPSVRQSKVLPRGARLKKNIGRIFSHVLLILVAVMMIFPLIWMLSVSLKTPPQQIKWPPEIIPNPLYPQNFVLLFTISPMATYLFNSAKIAILSVIGMCVSSSLAAFAFARMRFRGKNLIFGILLGTMMIPYATTVIPTFVIFRLLGWINTHAPLIVPNFFGSAYFVFLLRQSYLGIPQDFMDAAEMDGAGFFYIYSRIFIPLGMPMLTTVAVLQFLGSWNDLFGPLIYLNDQMKMTVQIGLTYLRGRAGTGVEHVGIVMAGSLMGILPMLLLYSFGQKYFVKGLARAGLKG
ncbi:MAG: carbohydrate ABC transporter permease [Anaerolineaceae bacterium]|jgi:ABC-type glycerol-3-phosphate transport system permease component